MTTPRFSREATPDDASYVAENETPEEDPAMEPSAETEPDAADATAEADPADELAVDDVDEQATPEEAPTTRPPAGPAPAWAWVAIALMGLLFAVGVTTLAVARNTNPTTPEAVEDAKTLVAELEKLNTSLAKTNDLMSNAIANAEQVSAKVQSKLASLSPKLDGVGAGVGQMRSLLGDKLSKPERAELSKDQDRLQGLKETLAQQSGRLQGQSFAGVRRDVGAIGDKVGDATRTGSSRADDIEARLEALRSEVGGGTALAGTVEARLNARLDALESRQATREELKGQIQGLRAKVDQLREALDARGQRVEVLAAALLKLQQAQALLQRRVDALGPRP